MKNIFELDEHGSERDRAAREYYSQMHTRLVALPIIVEAIQRMKDVDAPSEPGPGQLRHAAKVLAESGEARAAESGVVRPSLSARLSR